MNPRFEPSRREPSSFYPVGGVIALSIAGLEMLAVILWALVDVISPQRFPVLDKRPLIGLAVSLFFWLCVGTILFRTGMKGRAPDTARARIRWAAMVVLALFIGSWLHEFLR